MQTELAGIDCGQIFAIAGAANGTSAKRIKSVHRQRLPAAIVLDIEGTVVPISFVADVLFPYAREHVTQHLRDTYGEKETQEDIAAIKKQVCVCITHDLWQHKMAAMRHAMAGGSSVAGVHVVLSSIPIVYGNSGWCRHDNGPHVACLGLLCMCLHVWFGHPWCSCKCVPIAPCCTYSVVCCSLAIIMLCWLQIVDHSHLVAWMYCETVCARHPSCPQPIQTCVCARWLKMYLPMISSCQKTSNT